MHHFKKTKKKYIRFQQAERGSDECPFCSRTQLEKAVDRNETMYVIPNRTKYDMFEGRRVLEHVMIIPKRHVESYAEFNEQEKIDMVSLAGKYESKGYHIFGRGVNTVSRSIKHQHTHAIQAMNKWPKFYAYIRSLDLLLSR